MKKNSLYKTLVLSFIVILSGLTGNVSLADTAQPHGVISLTFDDGWQNQFSYAFPLMQSRGIVGTFYVVTSHLSVSNATTYLTFPELQNMQNSSCEIASHSVSHPDFTTLSDSQIRTECQDSKNVLQSYGLSVNNFAYPFGAYNAHTDSIVSQYYRSARDVNNPQIVLQLPFRQFHLPADMGDAGDPSLLSALESIVDRVYSSNEWAVIYFHQILPNVPNSPEVINTDTFATFLNYIKSKGVPTLTVNQALDLNSPPGSVAITPASVKMDIGQSATFSSSISGLEPIISYQWYLNSSGVPGAFNTNWTFTPSSPGNYAVYLNLTDSLGNKIQSNIVTDITVSSLPLVSVGPLSVNLTAGVSQKFVLSVIGGTPPYNYQWYLNGTTTSTTANYTFTPPTTGTYNIFASVTDNVNVTANSNNSTARVEPPTNVAITPTLSTIYVGQPMTFNSIVNGGITPYTYQWVLNDSAISGATNANWMFIPQSTGHFRVYLNVTDSFNLNAQSNIVTDITVYPQLAVSISPASMTMTINTNQQFNSNATGGLSPFAYQWYYANGTAISGATTSSLAYSANSIGTFSIYLNVTDSISGRTQSNLATINVTPSPTPLPTQSPTPTPSITLTPTPTSSPDSTPTVTPTDIPTVTPTDSTVSPSSSTSLVSPPNSSSSISSSVTVYYVVGAIAVIAFVLIAADLLVMRKRLLSPSTLPQSSEELPPPPPPPE